MENSPVDLRIGQIRFVMRLLLSIFLASSSLWGAPQPVVLYQFNEKSGAKIVDQSGAKPAVNLVISDLKAVKREASGLRVIKSTMIKSERPPARLISAVKKSGEITLSAWITPANGKQAGPARIVSLSKDSTHRNFTLGQEGDKYDVRLRTTKNDKNGIPSLPSSGRSVKLEKTHVVYTRSRDGRARVFLNGRKSGEKTVSGATSNWDGGYLLALGNEFTGDRPWLGEYHQVAIYDRALSESEVRGLFESGHKPRPKATPAELAKRRSRELFIAQIEPIFARHCLECHDASTAEGDLDLSQRTTAFADAKVISAGHLKKSVLWDSVESDEMPEKRDALTSTEKKYLREWIETGAVWTSETLDPSAHTLNSNAQNYPRRLTRSEYVETVRVVTGVDIFEEAMEMLPPDLRADGFTNTAYNLGVDFKHVEAHARLAELIVERMDVGAFAKRFSRSRSVTQKPIRALIESMGHWVLRGPLSSQDVDLYQGISTTVVATGEGFDVAVGYILQAMLQSPKFHYRIEPKGQIGSYEIASRLSYLVWGGPPDGELLEAAKRNQLYDSGQIKKQVERMLRDPRAVTQSQIFIAEWLHLERLDHLQPGKEKYPNWDPKLAHDMRRETDAFVKHILWEEKRPLSDLLNAQVTFVTPRLAKHYGLTASGKEEELKRVDLEKNPSRGGLLTQGSLLTMGGDDASMVTRGLFVLHDLLRGSVKDPPPGTDTTPVPSAPGRSQRHVAEKRMKAESCGGCHAKFEPLAFALERYDGTGHYSIADGFKNDLRQDGEVFIPGAKKVVKYRSAPELFDLLAASQRVQENITWKLAQFALGRPIATSDRPHLYSVHLESTKRGHTYQNVITALATSPLITQ